MFKIELFCDTDNILVGHTGIVGNRCFPHSVQTFHPEAGDQDISFNKLLLASVRICCVDPAFKVLRLWVPAKIWEFGHHFEHHFFAPTVTFLKTFLSPMPPLLSGIVRARHGTHSTQTGIFGFLSQVENITFQRHNCNGFQTNLRKKNDNLFKFKNIVSVIRSNKKSSFRIGILNNRDLGHTGGL